MPSVNWNIAYWGGEYDWPHGGEEWSEAWGGSFAQWWGVIAPRIASSLPAKSIVEIAPGYGRWSRFLISASDRYRGYDLSPSCVSRCREVFSAVTEGKDVDFLVNDGSSLGSEADASVDFVFSFDSLVHIEMDLVRAYLAEIGRVLKVNGRAFLHHSNFGMFEGRVSRYAHERGVSVSAERVRAAGKDYGLATRVQEMINWKTKECIDCFSLFERRDDSIETVIRYNDQFWTDADNIREYIAPYAS